MSEAPTPAEIGLLTPEEIVAWASKPKQRQYVEAVSKIEKRYKPLIEQAIKEANDACVPGAGAGRRIR